jgi:hypothetical protein
MLEEFILWYGMEFFSSLLSSGLNFTLFLPWCVHVSLVGQCSFDSKLNEDIHTYSKAGFGWAGTTDGYQDVGRRVGEGKGALLAGARRKDSDSCKEWTHALSNERAGIRGKSLGSTGGLARLQSIGPTRSAHYPSILSRMYLQIFFRK